ncbi:MAG: hypothetical protein J3K34DRAFT_474767 [Monoraphidium minutum]|nr:MAG: hypothetical protein J3K34DRAFT_474767 [Monoraphidium minutum]
MPLRADEEWTRQHPDQRLVIGVGVDGSAIGEKALAAAAAFYREKRGDKARAAPRRRAAAHARRAPPVPALVLLHVSDATKTWLPRSLQPRYLEASYTDKAARLHARAEWACKDKAAGESTCEALASLAESQGIGLLVVGSIGRKGDKGVNVLGHVSEYLLCECHGSVCVVRATSPAPPPGGGAEYLFAADGSKAAALAFCTLVRQLLGPEDKVLVAYSTYEHGATAESEEVFEPYRRIMADHKARGGGVQGECLAWHVARNKRVSEGILELAAARQANVLVVGISGTRGGKLGSVSGDLSLKAPCNMLLIKDRGDGSGGVAAAGARTLAGMLAPQGAARAAGALERKSLQASEVARAGHKSEAGIRPASGGGGGS